MDGYEVIIGETEQLPTRISGPGRESINIEGTYYATLMLESFGSRKRIMKRIATTRA